MRRLILTRGEKRVSEALPAERDRLFLYQRAANGESEAVWIDTGTGRLRVGQRERVAMYG